MNLVYRRVEEADLQPCFERFGVPGAYRADIRKQVPAVWRALLRQNQLHGVVIEDQDASRDQRLVGFGATVFVSDAFLEHALRDPQPYIRQTLIESILAGSPAALSLREAQEQNHGSGLNLFILNDAISARHLTWDELRLVHAKWGETLMEHAQYHLQQIVWECYGEEQCAWAKGCGLVVREDWTSSWNSGRDPRDRPFLLSVTREEARSLPGTHSSFLFFHREPRCGFTFDQQRMLQLALEGETDEELAAALFVSLSAIKKRWFAVYDKAALAGLELSGSDGTDGKRGGEKRRHLLNYLRTHPEELHPVNAKLGTKPGEKRDVSTTLPIVDRP